MQRKLSRGSAGRRDLEQALEDVIAGKIASALFCKPGETPLANSKDWYDLAFLSDRSSLNADVLRQNLETLAEEQGVELARFPDLLSAVDTDRLSDRWRTQLENFKLKTLGNSNQAVQKASQMIGPILDGTARGFYNCATKEWGSGQAQSLAAVDSTTLAVGGRGAAL